MEMFAVCATAHTGEGRTETGLGPAVARNINTYSSWGESNETDVSK